MVFCGQNPSHKEEMYFYNPYMEPISLPGRFSLVQKASLSSTVLFERGSFLDFHDRIFSFLDYLCSNHWIGISLLEICSPFFKVFVRHDLSFRSQNASAAAAKIMFIAFPSVPHNPCDLPEFEYRETFAGVHAHDDSRGIRRRRFLTNAAHDGDRMRRVRPDPGAAPAHGGDLPWAFLVLGCHRQDLAFLVRR
jgi:hypothetical protein